MNELSPLAAERQIIETLVRLTAPPARRHVVVCGDDGLCAALVAGGVHASLVTDDGGRGGHAVGIVGGARSRDALAGSIARIMPCLAEAATVAVVIAGDCGGLGPQAGALLAPFGFRIDAGVRCARALVLSAHRGAAAAMAIAA